MLGDFIYDINETSTTFWHYLLTETPLTYQCSSRTHEVRMAGSQWQRYTAERFRKSQMGGIYFTNAYILRTNRLLILSTKKLCLLSAQAPSSLSASPQNNPNPQSGSKRFSWISANSWLLLFFANFAPLLSSLEEAGPSFLCWGLR